jgi:hypothetical protein
MNLIFSTDVDETDSCFLAPGKRNFNMYVLNNFQFVLRIILRKIL